jgi:hypothetical protein
MDRVLLIIDDSQYSRHLEMTLRKVGFDVESINNEFNINDSILSFNPDFIICRGNSKRLSTLNVGQKLKDSISKYKGKTVLIFSEGSKFSADDLIKLKLDLLLFEPISTLRLAVHLISMAGGDFEFIKDKLLKFAITDNQFRNYEQQLLSSAGLTIDSEIQILSSMDLLPAFSGIQTTQIRPDSDLVPEMQINQEIQTVEQELAFRIDSYNQEIKKVDQDLKAGLKKRQTKKASNKLHKDLIEEGKADKINQQEQIDEKVRFANALFKKK